MAEAVADMVGGRVKSPLSETRRFELVLGITCHAIYHAGQIQLIKRLNGKYVVTVLHQFFGRPSIQ